MCIYVYIKKYYPNGTGGGRMGVSRKLHNIGGRMGVSRNLHNIWGRMGVSRKLHNIGGRIGVSRKLHNMYVYSNDRLNTINWAWQLLIIDFQPIFLIKPIEQNRLSQTIMSELSSFKVYCDTLSKGILWDTLFIKYSLRHLVYKVLSRTSCLQSTYSLRHPVYKVFSETPCIQNILWDTLYTKYSLEYSVYKLFRRTSCIPSILWDTLYKIKYFQ